MIDELINNRWFWVGLAIVGGVIIHRLFFSKDKATQLLESEYTEIVNSDKYKSKGQYD